MKQRVFDVLVARRLHDVVHVFGFVVEHCAFPVSEGVEVYFEESWVSCFVCYAFALEAELSCEVVDGHVCEGKDVFSVGFGQLTEHLD